MLDKIIKKEKDIKYIAAKLFFCLFFTFTLILDSNLVFSGDVFGSLEQTYFNSFSFIDIVATIFLTIGIYIIISIIEFVVDKITYLMYAKQRKNKKNIKLFFIITIIILICWLPYILSYFPGGIFPDTARSINQAIGVERLNNHNPILYTLLLKHFIKIGIHISSIQLGMELYTIFQILVMACTCSYSIYWLYKRNISTKYLILVTLFFSFFNLIPLYAISIWKDTPFCIALFWYSLYIADIVISNAKNIEKSKGAIIYSLLIFLVAFFRNNGIYVVIATTLVLMYLYRKILWSKLKKITIMSTATLSLCIIIQGPIYNYFKLNTEYVENLGILFQQICYVVVDGGNLNKNQKKFINNIYPIKALKETYNPCIIDKVKWDSRFNNTYLEQNKTKFIKIWFEIFIQNPKSYAKAYLLNTIGFWDVNKSTFDGYINVENWGRSETIMGVTQRDYIKIIAKHSIRKKLTPKKPISSAIFLFILLLGMLFTIYKKRYKNLMIYLPSLLVWITILIAVPLAFSLRYVYILVLMIPFSLIIPFLKPENETDKKELSNSKSIK